MPGDAREHDIVLLGPAGCTGALTAEHLARHAPSTHWALAGIDVRFTGEGGGARTVCEVSGGDPGYAETAKMLAESALCLAHDDLPQTAGQATTATAMGPALRDRLQRAGIGFAVA
ncbi:hypothetical protein DSM104329_02768 [Capillimicrobium parvum]|uniref:Saccharopine dehydrogenase NADP binding domain-containing protein n=1 Tax=Capillimicrobium parvum TaxID=2884022 RepID=A0A9E6XXN9_9ACTN|nr:hypothetical protein [Capillimicrobium parvum]UGS36364.1 hypothetical protein DSM104329_02768 [Capillimicrobium parvum]